MSQFDQFPRGDELGTFRLSENGNAYQEGESDFDKTYGVMLGTLRKNGDTAFADFLEGITPEIKKKLDYVINMHVGNDLSLLAKLGKENSPAVIAKITEWEKTIALAADKVAVRKANQSLADFLQEI